MIFGFASVIILARILFPEDFGIMGIALLTLAALETFSETGFKHALIQKKEVSDDDLNSAWTLLVIRGVLLAAVIFFAAPLVARFFEESQASNIIRAMAVLFLLQGLNNIGIVYFRKELEFNKNFLYEISGTLADFVVAVTAAFILRNVWAMVLGLIARNTVKCIMSYVIHPYRPRLNFRAKNLKELWGFGKWVLGSAILIYLITQGDDILVGKILGVVALGYYQMAYRISNTPATEITHVISEVTFPTYSKLQDDNKRFGEAYLIVLQLVAFLIFPIAVLVFVLANDFTSAFLGERWMPIVTAMQILAFAGLARAVGATAGPVIYAAGKPRMETSVQVLRFLILAALIYPFIMNWGIEGASIVVLISNSISTIGFCYVAIRITKCDVRIYSKILILPLVNAAISGVVVFTLQRAMGTSILEVIALVCTGVFIYIIMTFLFDKLFDYKMINLIQRSAKTMFSRSGIETELE